MKFIRSPISLVDHLMLTLLRFGAINHGHLLFRHSPFSVEDTEYFGGSSFFSLLYLPFYCACVPVRVLCVSNRFAHLLFQDALGIVVAKTLKKRFRAEMAREARALPQDYDPGTVPSHDVRARRLCVSSAFKL